MSQQQLLQTLSLSPLMAVLRGVSVAEIIGIARALYKAGIRFIEIPFTSPQAAECIRVLCQEMVNQEVYVGGGTVLSCEQLDQCIEAGGIYAVAPNADIEVINYARQRKCLFIPGFFTPSEAITAVQAGAAILKLFPAHAISLSYVQSVRTVLPKSVPIMVTGSLDVEKAETFLNAGCILGLGSSIYRSGDDIASVKKKAIPYMELIKARDK